MTIQKKTDWVDHLLGALCILFVWFCIVVVKEAKAHHDELLEAPKHEVRGQYPEIPKCDKELWLRIKDGCSDE